MKIGYARVSTKDQNLDIQIDALKKSGCEKIFTDKISGINPFKAGLEELLKFAREGDILVVWKLDRLDRGVMRLIEFACRLKDLNIGFKSLTENIDTTTPAGEFYFHMMAVLAQHERNIIRERTLAGQKAAKERGTHMGRPSAFTSEQWVLAKQEIQSGKLVADVAQIFNTSKDTIYRYIRNEKAAGRW